MGVDVSKNRDIDKIIILGSGPSILSLSEEEKAHVNRCKYVIAVNKFMAFYKKAGILPTHVYFCDRHETSFLFFRHILSVCRRDNLENLTFYTNSYFASEMRIQKKEWINYFKAVVVKIFFPKKITGKNELWLYPLKRGLLYPSKSQIYGITVSRYLVGGDWAKSLKEEIFHFRGSLTSVLNISTIIAPGLDVFLIGTDFNSSSYFYEEELETLDFNWKDYTYDLVKEKNLHFSFQAVEGKVMEDSFPYIMKSMAKTKNSLYCCNQNSLLINIGVLYKPLLE